MWQYVILKRYFGYRIDTVMRNIAVIGLGYVGLPLAVELSKKNNVIGFDINEHRVGELASGVDSTLEVSAAELAEAQSLSFSSSLDAIAEANVYIITVPTPVDGNKNPDLTPLIKASQMIGKVIRKDDIVIYESTVYPGATEEVCIPEVEKESGLTFNTDFFAGYSPERINPGDKVNRLPTIKKVTSGSTPEIAQYIDTMYGEIITAGTHLASSIKVAEASKVIENTQRDLNIALINELAIIFNALNIDTHEVLEAAATKWNFLHFKPGLVGGHCIGVDPYYLTFKAQSLGYVPDVILSGRRINDGMGSFVANRLVKNMLRKNMNPTSSRILLLGFTFKEDCPDIRNTRVVDIITELKKEYNIDVDVFDPVADASEIADEYGFEPCKELPTEQYDAVMVCVGHKEFIANESQLVKNLIHDNSVVFDVKGVLPQEIITERL